MTAYLTISFIISIIIVASILHKATYALKFEPGEFNSGLIFRRLFAAKPVYDNVTILYYADLTEYLEIKDGIRRCLNQLYTAHDKELPFKYMTLAMDFEEIVDIMERTEEDTLVELMQKHHSCGTDRVKANQSYGILDAAVARYYAAGINEIANNATWFEKLNLPTATYARKNIFYNVTRFSNLKKNFSAYMSVIDLLPASDNNDNHEIVYAGIISQLQIHIY